MSATIGTLTCATMSRNASALSWSGQDTRTMSTPAASDRRICATVPGTSVVSVLVMVWTVIGAPPPTGTAPTMIWRDTRRSIC